MTILWDGRKVIVILIAREVTRFRYQTRNPGGSAVANINGAGIFGEVFYFEVNMCIIKNNQRHRTIDVSITGLQPNNLLYFRHVRF